MAVTLGLLGCLSAACWDSDYFYGYGLENRRNHTLKITVRSALGCQSQVDLADPESFGEAVTRTLDPGEIVELDAFSNESVGTRAIDAGLGSPYPYTGDCGAVWVSLPDHDYEAVLAWDEQDDSPSAAYAWDFALVVEGTEERVRVHVPKGMKELGVPE